MNKPDNSFLLSQILAPIASEMEKIEEIAIENLDERIPLLREVGDYTFKAGGKRIRPALLLFSAGMHGEVKDEACLAATVIEYIHAASLLHDDIVDDAELRRGRETVKKAWGNETAVLTGDYLFMLSFKILTQFKQPALLQSILETATAMTEGELLQLKNKVKILHEADILNVIEKKTSSLIGSAMQIGAILSDTSIKTQNVMRTCGEYIGTAFQLIDDALDYDVKNTSLGKVAGKDFFEQKMTLPLYHLFNHANPDDLAISKRLFKDDTHQAENLKEISSLMTKYDSIAYTERKAQKYCEMAINLLAPYPDSIFKTGIIDLTNFIISRTV